MKRPLLVFLSLAALVLGGCASAPPTRVDTGAIQARSFSFIDGGSKTEAAYADKRETTHLAIQEAIAKNLAGKGLTKAASGGDVIVAYLVIVGDNTGIETVRTYFGYNEDTTALSDQAFAAYTGSKNPNQFQAGTLLIDIVDAKSFKLLERNYASRPLLRDATAEQRTSLIQSAVDEALAKLQIAK
ncbi:MAG: DUF4136 domain-containing protein [Burkholderiales bacterium]|nr:DUF4136 domain-containing protein [Opitutaceae bacterium]